MKVAGSSPETRIEQLEPRIAPATLLSTTAVRYIDVDGDVVIVSISKGSLDLLTNFTFAGAGRGEQLQRISLTGEAFSGTNITVTSRQTTNGDGLANIGHIDAAGLDLGRVRIPGDLGQIDAGDANFETPGVVVLRVNSLGRFGLVTQPLLAASLASNILGDMPLLQVNGMVLGAFFSVEGASDGTSGNIASIKIGGSLRGNAGDDSGSIHSTGSIDSVEIGRNIIGGAGVHSGGILAGGDIGNLIVGGMLQSGSGAGSGSIRAGENIGLILVRESIIGNDENSVLISATGALPAGVFGGAASLGELRVLRNARFVTVLAGYNPAAEPVNGDAQIERISVGGNWIASTAVAGAIAGPDGLFGTSDDAIRFPHVSSVTAKIASIHISGKARGTTTPTTDHFGFVAEEIGELKIGGKAVHLMSGSSNDNDPTTPSLALGTDSDLRIMEVSSLAPPPNLLAAVSRKIHGSAGAFDIDLPLTGTVGIESRADNTLMLVFTFDHDITGGIVSVGSGTAIIAGAPVFNGNQMIVTLSGVADVQTIIVRLSGVTDTDGGILPSIEVAAGILQGDVNGTRAVNTSDVNIVRAFTVPGTIGATNFRTDLDLSGQVDAADVNAVRSSSGNQLD